MSVNTIDKATACRSARELQGELDNLLAKLVSGEIPGERQQKAKDRLSFLARVILRRQGVEV